MQWLVINVKSPMFTRTSSLSAKNFDTIGDRGTIRQHACDWFTSILILLCDVAQKYHYFKMMFFNCLSLSLDTLHDILWCHSVWLNIIRKFLTSGISLTFQVGNSSRLSALTCIEFQIVVYSALYSKRICSACVC